MALRLRPFDDIGMPWPKSSVKVQISWTYKENIRLLIEVGSGT